MRYHVLGMLSSTGCSYIEASGAVSLPLFEEITLLLTRQYFKALTMNASLLLILTACCLAPAFAFTQFCGGEVRSTAQYTQSLVSVTFQNNSPRTVKIEWLDYGGYPVLYRTLAPHESYVQQTYVSHPWIATDAHTGEHLLLNGQPVFLPVDCHATAYISE